MESGSRENSEELKKRFPRWVLTILPAAIFLLALNPWFTPEQHDDVLYFFGAKSIVETGEFALDGTPITDWPPVFPVFLAGARIIAGDAVWVAKLVVFAFVVAGLFAIRAMAKVHRFELPVAVAALTCLLPISLISGASVLSEWPFLALSMAFLITLQRLGSSRSMPWMFAAGALLALASLTRFAGVFLGIAVLAQMWTQFRQARVSSAAPWYRAIAPEIGVAMMGAIPWLLWKMRCSQAIASGDAPTGAYDRTSHYLERFSNIDPYALFSMIETTLFSLRRAVETRVDSAILSGIIVVLLMGLLVFGMVRQFRTHGVQPADWYVLAMLALLLGDLVKPERYFLPIAPFLIGYIILGLRDLSTMLYHERSRLFVKGAIVMWAAWLILLDGYLLFVGNSDSSRGGFSMLASPHIESYYRGRDLDLYHAIGLADAQAPAGEEIGSVGFHGKYVMAFAGRGYANFPEEEFVGVSYMVVRDGSELSSQIDLKPWQIVEKLDSHTVYKRGTN
ncbi:MAG: hypothetical protein ACI9UA_003432 [Pseudoalteromonas tetraodonis]|jgi:hypothetical protein